MLSRTHAHIDLEALHYNLLKIKAHTPQSKVLAMIKCNAYGHGAVPVAKKIEKDVSVFGVMFLPEALQLSNAGIRKPIVILTGFVDSEELKIIDGFGFESVIHNFEQIEILEKNKLSNALPVWLKLDTGMHRLGFQPHQVTSAYQRLTSCSVVRKPLRLMTHFAEADNMGSNKTIQQISCFKEMTSGLDGEWCMANSAAIVNWPETHLSWIRPGILLYGASPFSDRTGKDLGFMPVMTLTSRVITIHELAKGEAIGYGSIFRCPENMRIGTIAVGYGDGYPRNTVGAPILVEGIRTKTLGRVAMDMLGIDLSHIPNAKVGSQVVLWGRGLPAEEIAQCSGEIPYELFCRLTSRVQYNFYQHSTEIKI
jgi:alanine racemase